MNRVVYIVDDDAAVRDSLEALFAAAGLRSRAYAGGAEFLAAYRGDRPGVLVLDEDMPGMSGAEVHAELVRRGVDLPVIFLTGLGDIPMTVRAMRRGAVDFLTKPADGRQLVALVARTLDDAVGRHRQRERLTARERAVLSRVARGMSSKAIAWELAISVRTVDAHRAHLLQKLDARSSHDLVARARSLGLATEESASAPGRAPGSAREDQSRTRSTVAAPGARRR